jgi:S1-C subfamily serine protease
MRRRDLLALGAAAATWPLTGRAAGMADTVARIKPSVVLVGTYRETDTPRFQLRGSGFLIGRGQQVVTCSHVLPGADADLVVQVLRPDGTWARHPVHLGALDERSDLALLTLDSAIGPGLVIGDSGKVREGDDLAFMGFPIGNLLGYSHVVHRAMLSSITAALLPSPDAERLRENAIRGLRSGNFSLFQLDAVAYPGNSGGPLFRPETGEVVGVMNMVLLKGTRESALSQPSGIAYAVPAARLRELLERAR